jgi:hypothetical protein
MAYDRHAKIFVYPRGIVIAMLVWRWRGPDPIRSSTPGRSDRARRGARAGDLGRPARPRGRTAESPMNRQTFLFEPTAGSAHGVGDGNSKQLGCQRLRHYA